jgi:hypothetical protein
MAPLCCNSQLILSLLQVTADYGSVLQLARDDGSASICLNGCEVVEPSQNGDGSFLMSIDSVQIVRARHGVV